MMLTTKYQTLCGSIAKLSSATSQPKLIDYCYTSRIIVIIGELETLRPLEMFFIFHFRQITRCYIFETISRFQSVEKTILLVEAVPIRRILIVQKLSAFKAFKMQYSVHYHIVFLNLLIVFVVSEDQNVTAQSVDLAERKVLSLKNVRYPILQSNVTVNSDVKQPFQINADAEQIFLPIVPRNYHPDRVLERLETTNKEYRPYLLDFSAYILKPFEFDYTKVLAQARNIGRQISHPTADPAILQHNEPNLRRPEGSSSHSSSINGIVSVSKPSAVTQSFGSSSGDQQIVDTYESGQTPHFEGLHRVPQYYRKYIHVVLLIYMNSCMLILFHLTSEYDNFNGNTEFKPYNVKTATSRPHTSQFHLNIGEIKQHGGSEPPRAEQLIRPFHAEPMIQFDRPNINAAPVGYSFYDEMRHKSESPNFSEHGATTLTTLTDEYPSSTLKPLIHKFAYVTTQRPYLTTAKTTETSTENNAATTTKQTDNPDYNRYTFDATTTDQPYDDSTTTHRNSKYNKNDDDNKSYSGKHTQSTEDPYSSEYTEDPSFLKEFSLDDYKNSEESQDDRPSFKGFTSQSNGRKKSKFKPSKGSRSQYTRFSSENEKGRPYFEKEVSTNEKPSRKNKYLLRNRHTTQAPQTTTEAEYDEESDDRPSTEALDDDYTYREIKTYTDSFGSKPGKSYNKFSQIKVIRQDRTTTERPSYRNHNKENRFKPASSKYSTVTEIAPTVNSKKNSEKKSYKNTDKKLNKQKTNNKLSRGKVKFLYDEELYHPEESRVVSSVYKQNGLMIRNDLDQAPSYRSPLQGYHQPFPHRQQLNAITSTTTNSPYEAPSPTNNPFLFASQPLVEYLSLKNERPKPVNTSKSRGAATVRHQPEEKRYFQ